MSTLVRGTRSTGLAREACVLACKAAFWVYVAVAWFAVAALALLTVAVAAPRGSRLATVAATPFVMVADAALLCDGPTVYATGFSEAAFAKVAQGMTKVQVLALLGEPLARHPYKDGDETWEYSRAAPRAAHHQNRVIIFAAAGVVREAHSCCED